MDDVWPRRREEEKEFIEKTEIKRGKEDQRRRGRRRGGEEGRGAGGSSRPRITRKSLFISSRDCPTVSARLGGRWLMGLAISWHAPPHWNASRQDYAARLVLCRVSRRVEYVTSTSKLCVCHVPCMQASYLPCRRNSHSHRHALTLQSHASVCRPALPRLASASLHCLLQLTLHTRTSPARTCLLTQGALFAR